MYLTTRNSYALGSRLSRLLDDAFGGWDTLSQSNGTAAWTPAVDIFEQENEIRIVAEVPGVSPEDVKISLEDDVLSWVLRPDAHVAAVLTRAADVGPAVARLLARPVPVPA